MNGMRFTVDYPTYVHIRRWVEGGQFIGSPEEQANSADTADRLVMWLERQDVSDAVYFLNAGLSRVYEGATR